jgi:hypothetical protein
MALYITKKIHWHRMAQTFIAQMIAGMAASGFVAALLPGPLTIATTLDPSISIARGLFLEAFVTSMLILTILMLEGGPAKPMYIGASLFVAELCCVFYTLPLDLLARAASRIWGCERRLLPHQLRSHGANLSVIQIVSRKQKRLGSCQEECWCGWYASHPM